LFHFPVFPRPASRRIKDAAAAATTRHPHSAALQLNFRRRMAMPMVRALWVLAFLTLVMTIASTVDGAAYGCSNWFG
jgi:hypothetical protein